METIKDELTYFITGIKLDPDADPLEDTPKQRPYIANCFGFKKTLDGAKKVVEENVTDIHEGCYNYAVIEGILPRLYPIWEKGVEYHQFYRWDKTEKRYIPCDEPSYFKERKEKRHIEVGCFAI